MFGEVDRVSLRQFYGYRRRSGSKAEKLRTSRCCPLRPRERTSSDTTGISALCQKRTNAPQQKVSLFDHFVGEGEDRALATPWATEASASAVIENSSARIGAPCPRGIGR
jgi:hypothetical protein